MATPALIPDRFYETIGRTPFTVHVADSGDIRIVSVSEDTGDDHERIDDPLLLHRLQFKWFASSESHELYRKYLEPLYTVWDSINGAFFGGRLVPPHITLEEPSSPRIYGEHSPVSSWGSGSHIRLRPSLLDGSHPHVRNGPEFEHGRFRLVADCLLHEVVHQYHAEETGKTENSYRGHGPAFRDTCNMIGERLGLKPVRVAKERGKQSDLPSCGEWPLNVRPADYYLGAFIYSPKQAKGSAARADSRMPEELSDWLDAQPDLRKDFELLRKELERQLDRFFAKNPAPPSVMKQAVTYAMKAYIRRMERRDWRIPPMPGASATPAVVGEATA